MSFARRHGIYSKYDGRCAYCGLELLPGDFTVDHILARELGGGDGIDNLNPSCRSCNGSKGAKTVEQYRLWLTYRDIVKSHRFCISHLEFMVFHLGLREKMPRPDHVFYFERLSHV